MGLVHLGLYNRSRFIKKEEKKYVGKLPKMRGKWVFGQYATFLPEKDFKVIVNKARKKGWI
jgi:hypothetical protein